MTADAALAIFETAKSLGFAKRRVSKGLNGDPSSFAVAGAQIGKAIKNAAIWNNAVGRTAKVCIDTINTAAKSSSLAGYAAKTFNFATTYVNPLIATTGVIKVACAKDKSSEAINQGLALGTMFTAEGLAKKFITEQGRKALKESNIYKNSGALQSVCKFMTDIDKYASRAKSSKLGKIGIPLVKAATFIGVSIAGYAIGSKIAKEINSARKEHALSKHNEENPFAQKQISKAEITVNKATETTETIADNKDSKNKKIEYSA